MATFRFAPFRRSAALALVLCLACGPGLATAALAQEAGHAAIRGDLYQPDGKEKLAGGKVTAINVRTGKQYPSNVTGDNGAYEISGLPAGTYDLVVESSGGVFVADNLIDLDRGESISLSYAVQPSRPANRNVAGMKAPRGSATVIGSFKGNDTALASAPRSFWSSPGGIVLITVLGAGAAVAIANKNDNNASPSSP
ncbi:MAG TPA: carboxypeptidase-like regulatory domain-containing protein [Candidatus Polarisedimenticolia bacterium]|nr:carboxypeptidase-like regulatory domain-containing protein [Candidatus Polarisedimenticolia bacterium]